jgi:peptidoglycan/xylan/chitin deacetylase (PgdA/CDA1 family)
MKADANSPSITQASGHPFLIPQRYIKYLKFCCTLLFFSIIVGCVKKEITIEPSDFAFITPRQGDSLESLAKEYLGTSSLAWRIKEFNGIQESVPDKELVIPLKPFRPGGLTAAGYQLVPVLSYHNFSKGRSNNKLTVSAHNFEEQMNYLKNENYHFLTPNQMLLFLEFGQVPRKSVIITIDDGWSSTYQIAYPILKKNAINATLFIPTNFIKSGTSKTLSWDQIRQMVNDRSVDIQCHGKSHQDLNTRKYGQSFAAYIDSIEKEVVHSKSVIYEKLGTPVTALAYPFGNTNPVVIEILTRNGYQTAFTVTRAGNPFFIQNLRLNRSMIYGSFKLPDFINNLKTFQSTIIDTLEPIDTLQTINEIAYQSPANYEAKSQWRTALLAWKLRRDWLIAHQGKPSSINRLARLDDSEELIKVAVYKVREIDAKIKNTAAKYFSEAMQANDSEKTDRLLLRTLLYNPDHQPALEQLKNNLKKRQLQKYWVKQNDTFKNIAMHLYQDKSKSVLIPFFNPTVIDNTDLLPGMKLILPTAAAVKAIKAAGGTRCRVPLTKPAKILAADYYAQANEYFSQDQISKAIASLKTAICLNPKHQQAIEMLGMLKAL